MGLLFSVISFWSPLTECLVGHLQDKMLCPQHLQCLCLSVCPLKKTLWFGGRGRKLKRGDVIGPAS